MAVRATFTADFASFQKAVQQADVQLKAFEADANKVQTSLNRMGDSFSGQKIISQATLMAAAMEKAGGITKLTEAELRKLNDTTSEAALKMQKLGYEVPKSFQDIQKAVEALPQPTQTWSEKLNNVTTVLQGLLALQVVQWAKQAVAATFAYADQLENLKQATGVSLQGLQRLEAIGASSGVSLDTLAGSVEQLQKHLDDPKAVAAIEQMGLGYERIRALRPEDQFLEIAKSLSAIEDPVERANAGAALFGKTWFAVAPAITKDVDEILKHTVTMSDGTINALDKAGDAWNQFLLNSERRAGAFLGTLVLMGQQIKTNKDIARLLNPFTTAQEANRLYEEAQKEIERQQISAGVTQAATGLGGKLTAGGPVPDPSKAIGDLNYAIEHNKKLQEQSLESQHSWWVLLNKEQRSSLNTMEKINELAKNTLRPENFVPGTGTTNFNPTGFLGQGNAPGGLLGIVQGRQIAGGQGGLGPADIRSAAYADIEKQTKLFATDLVAGVPNAIQAAIQGGGAKFQAAGSAFGAALFGKDSAAFKSIKSGVEGLFGQGGIISGIITNSIPIIGSLLGPLVGLVGKLFGPSEESKYVSPLRDEFFRLQGGLETLNPKIQELTGSLKLVQAVFDAKTVNQYNAAIKAVEDTLARIPMDVETTVRVNFDVTDFQRAADQAAAGYNPDFSPAEGSMGGVVYAARGRIIPFTPRGSDTVPAMLTPGEMVLTRQQQRALLGGQGGTIINDLRGSVVASDRALNDLVDKIERRLRDKSLAIRKGVA